MDEITMAVLGSIITAFQLFSAGALAGAVSAYTGFVDKQAKDGTTDFDREKFVLTIIRGAAIGGVTTFALGSSMDAGMVMAFSALAAMAGDTIGRRVWGCLKAYLGEQKLDTILGKLVWAIDYVAK